MLSIVLRGLGYPSTSEERFSGLGTDSGVTQILSIVDAWARIRANGYQTGSFEARSIPERDEGARAVLRALRAPPELTIRAVGPGFRRVLRSRVAVDALVSR